MRGHKEIIAARLAKKAPSFVFLNDYPCRTDWFENAEHATVCTHGDLLSGLDLRFLVNLSVTITAMSEDRAKGLFERVKAAGAATVAACHVNPGKPALNQSGWAQIWRKENTNA